MCVMLVAKMMTEVDPDGLAIQWETLWVAFWGLLLGLVVVYARRAVEWFQRYK